MKVIATREGFYQGKLIKVGQVFDFDGEELGKWMKPVTDKKEQAPAPKKQKPVDSKPVDTLSEITKQNQADEEELLKQKSADA